MNHSQGKNPRSKNEQTKAAQKGQSGKDQGKESGNKNENKGRQEKK